MNSQDFRNLQEAYLDVYENEQLDEMPYRVFTKNDKGEEVSVGGTYATGKTARTKANKEDEKVGGYRHSVRKVEEETDIFDYVMEYLISEGYAETPEAALAIMGNMSEDWRESIIVEDIESRREMLKQQRIQQRISSTEAQKRKRFKEQDRETLKKEIIKALIQRQQSSTN